MRVNLAGAILEIAFRRCNRTAAMHDAAFGANGARVLAHGAHEVELELERSPGVAFRDRREDRAAEGRVEKGCGEHGSDRVVVAEVRGAFENRAATKVTIVKESNLQPDFFSDPRALPSDGLEEKAILYRIRREIEIERALAKAQKKQNQAQ